MFSFFPFWIFVQHASIIIASILLRVYFVLASIQLCPRDAPYLDRFIIRMIHYNANEIDSHPNATACSIFVVHVLYIRPLPADTFCLGTLFLSKLNNWGWLMPASKISIRETNRMWMTRLRSLGCIKSNDWFHLYSLASLRRFLRSTYEIVVLAGIQKSAVSKTTDTETHKWMEGGTKVYHHYKCVRFAVQPCVGALTYQRHTNDAAHELVILVEYYTYWRCCLA